MSMCEHNCLVRTPQAAKTETTKQKQQDTTQNHSIYSSVAISVHCCLHWCSHRHLASVFAPYIYPAILHRCSHLAFFLCAFPMVAQARFSSPCRVCRDQLTASPGQRTAGVSVGVLPKLSAQRGSIGYRM